MNNLAKFCISIFVIFTFLFLFIFFYNRFFVIEENPNIDEQIKDSFVVSDEEKDKDIVTYYMDGMKTSSFLSAINKSGKYEESDGEEYSNIYYDFYSHMNYNELSEIYKKLNRSEAVKLENIGDSEDGRTMYSLEIGFGNKKVMLDAGIHAAEIANPLFLTKFMIDLVNDYESEKPSQRIINLLNNYKIVLLPCENPDGYDLHLFGLDIIKKNAFIKNTEDLNLFYYKGNINGVDINRNFPSEHGGLYYNELTPSTTLSFDPTGARLSYYPGEVLGSENETKNIMYWMNKWYKSSVSYVSLHSAGRSVYNGKPNLSDEFNNLSNELALIVSKNTKYYKIHTKEAEDIGYGNDGTATDFYSELVSGFKFSNKTGRLVSDSYKSVKNNLEYKSGAITIETLTNFTNSLTTIKSEWEEQKLYNIFLDIIELGKIIFTFIHIT